MRTSSGPTTTSPSRQRSPKRPSSRSASLAAGTGASRYSRATCRPARSRARASTRPTVPGSSAVASASSTSGWARRSRPVVVAIRPPGATRRIGRASCAAAAASTFARASASVSPPTSTPPIVVPLGSVPRSASAITPAAAASSARSAATAASAISARRPRRRGRLTEERNGPDIRTDDGSGRPSGPPPPADADLPELLHEQHAILSGAVVVVRDALDVEPERAVEGDRLLVRR